MSDEALKRTLDEAEWAWIKPHVARDAVIIVAEVLDLLDVGHALAGNESGQVRSWLDHGLLSKPTAEQVKIWDQTPKKRFMTVVVQPYVLVQQLRVH